MLTFRTHSTLFTHVIAAHTRDEAIGVSVVQLRNVSGSSTPIDQWHTPDIWTRRAVDMAMAPKIIDTIPRFVVDRKDGPLCLDIDDVPAKLTHAESFKISRDSVIHGAWMAVLEAHHSGSDYIKATIACIAKHSDAELYMRYSRALAGAWGLGPIPEWHAAILPALIALDLETSDCANAFLDNVFEMDRDELIAELDRCALIDEHIPRWCIASMCELESGLSSGCDAHALRIRSSNVLSKVGWLP